MTTASTPPPSSTDTAAPTGEVCLRRHRTDWNHGVAFVHDPDGWFATQFDAGKQGRRMLKRWPIGTQFTVRLITHDGPDIYDQTLRFRVTGDPDDFGVHWTGPGLASESERTRMHPIGFEYGVTVEGAVLVTE